MNSIILLLVYQQQYLYCKVVESIVQRSAKLFQVFVEKRLTNEISAF